MLTYRRILGLADTSATVTAAAIDACNEEEEGGLSWLIKAASGQCSAPVTSTSAIAAADPLTAALSGQRMPATSSSRSGLVAAPARAPGSDWLALAASGAPINTLSASAPSAPRPKPPIGKPARRNSGRGWITDGKLGLLVDDEVFPTRDTGQGGAQVTKTPAKNAPTPAKERITGDFAESRPGGWLTAAVTSGRLGAPGDGHQNDDDTSVDGEPSHGITIETQTDENIEQAVKDSTKPKLPPWAKPWSPPRAPIVDLHLPTDETPRAEDKRGTKPESSPTMQIDWISKATTDSPCSAAQGTKSLYILVEQLWKRPGCR